VRRFIGKREVIEVILLNSVPVIGVIFFGWNIVTICTFLWVEMAIFVLVSNLGIVVCGYYWREKAHDLYEQTGSLNVGGDFISNNFMSNEELNLMYLHQRYGLFKLWLPALFVGILILGVGGIVLSEVVRDFLKSGETLAALLVDPIFRTGIIIIFLEQLIEIGCYIKDKLYEVDIPSDCSGRYYLRLIYIGMIITFGLGILAFILEPIFDTSVISYVFMFIILFLKLFFDLKTMNTTSKQVTII